jgi:NADH-quinone oxidoreductase subunit L
MPITAVTFLLATLAIAGVPPLSGFFSKDEILYLVYAHAPRPIYWMAWWTAGLTAFYMTRLFVYAFLGRSRAAHPEHIHESPLAMTMPLVILAGLSVISGFFGMPPLVGEVIGVNNRLGGWLSSLGQITPHHVDGFLQEGSLMLLSAAWGLSCVAAAFVLYRGNLEWTRNLKIRLAPLYHLVANKYYIDEIYDVLIIRPLKGCANFVLYKTFDAKFIDGLLVHGPADLSLLVGRTVSAVQNGSMGRYVLLLLLASLGLIGVLMWGL